MVLLKLKMAVWRELQDLSQLAERRLQDALAAAPADAALAEAVTNARRMERRCRAARHAVQQALASVRSASA